MRLSVLLCFLLALLPLAVLSHDLYLAYQEAEQSRTQFGEKPVNFSDVGFLWVQYSPDSYDWVRRSMTPQAWKGMIDPLLQKTALIITALPVAVFAMALLVFKFLKDIPSMLRLQSPERRKQKGGIAIQSMEKSKKRMTYKRK